jgi:hypothetical protein
MTTALGPAPAKVVPTPAPAVAQITKPVEATATAQVATPTPVVATPTPVKAAETVTVAPVTKPEIAAVPTASAPKIDPPVAASPTQENLFGQPKAEAAPIKKPGPVAPVASSSVNSPRAVAESLAAAPATEKKPLAVATAQEVPHRVVRPIVEADPKRNRIWIAVAAVVFILLIVGWRLMRTEPAATGNGAAKPISTLADPDPGSKTPAATATKPSATRFAAGKSAASKPAPVTSAPVKSASASSAAASVPASAAGRTQWRVVAYTYNRQDQAQQKADSIGKQHPSLNAEVFSPSGHAPYLVTVGGAMSREQAESFKQKARSQGLPHDIYAQNYSR